MLWSKICVNIYFSSRISKINKKWRKCHFRFCFAIFCRKQREQQWKWQWYFLGEYIYSTFWSHNMKNKIHSWMSGVWIKQVKEKPMTEWVIVKRISLGVLEGQSWDCSRKLFWAVIPYKWNWVAFATQMHGKLWAPW